MRRTAELGLFLALALILSYVESLIPFTFGIPGIKLGLPNLIVVMVLCGQTQEVNRKEVCSIKRYGIGNSARTINRTDHASKSRFNRENAGYGDVSEAFLINVLRIVLSGFLFSNLYAIFYALAGAVLSFSAMLLGRRAGCFSAVGISVLGGVFHNIGQLLVAMFVVETFYVGYYLPFLIAAGTVTGALLGIAALEIMPYLKRLKRNYDYTG